MSGRQIATPQRSRLLRIASLALFAVAVLVAGGAAAVGAIDSAPVWLAVAAAVVAAVVGLIAPQADTAIREREKRQLEEAAATARLTEHLDSVQRRFEAHVGADNPFDMSADSLIERRVLPRKPAGEDAMPLSELVTSLRDPDGPTRRMLLLAEGGAGKTTSLLRLAHDAAAQAKVDPQAPIPVYVDLSVFDASDHGFNRLFSMAANAMRGVDQDGFDRLWRLSTRPLLFLFDGLNEQRGAAVACNAGLRELTDRAPHLAVITSRPTAEADELAAAGQAFEAADLLRLERGQVERFLRERGADRLFASMNDDLRDLSQNPFMLMALLSTSAGRPDGTLPANMGELYRSFVDDYIYERREPGRGHARFSYAGVKKPRLAELADRMTSAGETVRAGDGEPDEVDIEIVANGVLRRASGGLEFMHQSVQEYFTAVALETVPAEEAAGRARPLVWRHVDAAEFGAAAPEDPYRVPLLMLSGLLESSDELVKALAPRDPLLAAACVRAGGPIDRSTRTWLRDRWLALLSRAHERYRRVGIACLATARMADDEVVHTLIDVAVDDPVYSVSAAADDALTALGVGRCESYLAEKIQEPASCDRATVLLIRHAPERAAHVLLQHWLEDASASGRERIVDALREVDTAVAVEQVRALAAGSAQVDATAALIERLQAEPEKQRGIPTAESIRIRTRKRAGEAREEVAGTPTERVLDLLQDSDGWIRSAAAATLAQRGYTPAVPSLLDALVRQPSTHGPFQSIAAALGQLGGDDLVATMLQRAHENAPAELVRVPGPWPPDLAEGAVPQPLRAALAKIGFREEFRATGSGGRWFLVREPAGTAGAEIVVEEQGEQLVASRTGTGEWLLRALALITSPAGLVLPELLTILNHDDAGIRTAVLDMLGGSPDDSVVDAIAVLLPREGAAEVIAAAGTALARIGSTQALEHLVELIALGKLDSTYAARPEDPQKVEALLAARAGQEHGTALAAVIGALAHVRKRQAMVWRGEAAAHDRQRRLLVDVALGEHDAKARQRAAEALRWSAGDAGIAELASELHSKDPERRMRSAVALGRIEDDAAAPALDAALAVESDASVRCALAKALVDLRADDVLPAATRALVELALGDEDLDLRRDAYDSLRRLRTAVADDVVLGHLTALRDRGADEELERAVARMLEVLEPGG